MVIIYNVKRDIFLSDSIWAMKAPLQMPYNKLTPRETLRMKRMTLELDSMRRLRSLDEEIKSLS